MVSEPAIVVLAPLFAVIVEIILAVDDFFTCIARCSNRSISKCCGISIRDEIFALKRVSSIFGGDI